MSHFFTPRHPRRRGIAPSRRWSLIAFGLVGLAAMVQTGCLPLTAQLLQVAGLNLVPAAYDGLEKTKVAVVVVTEDSQHGKDPAARLLAAQIAHVLRQNVDDIQLVREEKIEDYLDLHGFEADYTQLGTEVKADKVLAIELNDLTLREGPTLYRGQSSVRVKVIDPATDTEAFSNQLEDFTYPKLAGQDAGGITEKQFMRVYFKILADEVCRSFYPYDSADRIALDRTLTGR